MKRLVFILFYVIPYLSYAQIKTINLGVNDIPKSIKYNGKIANAVKYTDNEGENLVITSTTGVFHSKEETRGADLYAYHFLIFKDSVKLTWQMHDFIKECGEDVIADFLPNTFNITDLDNNGKAEVWVMYKTTCTGDISPLDMKVIMHEGNKKFAMRGTNRVKVSEKEYVGGKYVFDDAFLNGNKLFMGYAKNLWEKNLMQVW